MTNPSPIPTQVEVESVANDHVFQNLLADWHDKAESDIPGASVIYKRLCAHIDSIITARVDDKAAQLELMTEYRYNALMQVVKLKRALAVSQAAPAQHTQVVDHSKTLSNQALDTDIRASNTEVVDRQAAPAKAEGWKTVPIEPTEDMIYEGGIGRRDQMVDAADVWRAMLNAAPSTLPEKTK